MTDERNPIPLPDPLEVKPGESVEQRDSDGNVFRIIKRDLDGQLTYTAPPGPPGEHPDDYVARVVRAAPPLSKEMAAKLRSIFASARARMLED